MYRMTFGKWRPFGVNDPIAVPTVVAAEVHDLDPPLRRAAADTLSSRGDTDEPAPPSGGRALLDVQTILKKWRNEMAMRYHPDRGGDVRAMQAINAGYDRLLELLDVAS